jgi:muramoyltetrapeptide carboxypeptidase
MRIPPSLPPGGTIGIVAPACWPEPAWLEAASGFFRSHGYQVVVHPQCSLQWGRLAGPDQARADALQDMFRDPQIDAILCARGGVGSVRLLDLLDYELISRHPKPLIGFSDITALLQAVALKAGIITYHGPVGWNFAQATNDQRTGQDLLAVLSDTERFDRTWSDVEVLRPGQATGRLFGGNLHLLTYLAGTPFDLPRDEDLILFIEDVDEPLYKIDMLLHRMKRAGALQRVKAVIVGELVGITDGEDNTDRRPYGPSLSEILLNVLPEVPLCLNVPCGHGAYLTTLPIGMKLKVALSGRSLSAAYTT